MFAIIGLRESAAHVLWKAFTKADVDESGELTILELLGYVDVDYSPFAHRVFSMMDDDQSGGWHGGYVWRQPCVLISSPVLRSCIPHPLPSTPPSLI